MIKYSSSAQRQSQPGEPSCKVCGRYGEYVCDATNDDVCSFECRDVCIAKFQEQKNLKVQPHTQYSNEIRRKFGIAIAKESLGEKEHSLWPPPILEFKDQSVVTLPMELISNLTEQKIEKPTPVQMQTIPCVLQGHHIVVSAPTGTGKTASYLIPAITQILHAREQKQDIVALILAPVRELAIQIESVAKLFMRGIPDMKTALLAGGFPVPTQRYRLQNGIQVIVATPGRFLDIFTNYSGGETILSRIRTCVIDEVDLMLDVGFRPQITQLVELIRDFASKAHHDIQLLFYSATILPEIETFVQQILKPQKYTRISISGDESKAKTLTKSSSLSLNPNISQQIRWADDKRKKRELFEYLQGKEHESTLVFVGSKQGATLLAEAIEKRCGIAAAAIHAEKSQHERLCLLETFVKAEVPVLVSTNVLSRGMDLLNVDNVVVYDFPRKLTDYIHLIGRVGRADEKTGNALTLVNQEDCSLFHKLVPLLRQARVPVPRKLYQSLHSQANAAKYHDSNKAVGNTSKQVVKVRQQLLDDTNMAASEWKEWTKQSRKRRMCES